MLLDALEVLLGQSSFARIQFVIGNAGSTPQPFNPRVVKEASQFDPALDYRDAFIKSVGQVV